MLAPDEIVGREVGWGGEVFHWAAKFQTGGISIHSRNECPFVWIENASCNSLTVDLLITLIFASTVSTGLCVGDDSGKLSPNS